MGPGDEARSTLVGDDVQCTLLTVIKLTLQQTGSCLCLPLALLLCMCILSHTEIFEGAAISNLS